MSFLHLSLLAGLSAIAVPLALHLFGQRQPQLIDFPALRFVRETTQEQSTSWQLRHILLLLLRILLFAALAFALTRPRVHSAALGSVIGISSIGVCALLATLIAGVAFATKRPMQIWLVAGLISLLLWGVGGYWGYHTLTKGPSVPTSDQTSPVATALILDNGPTMEYMADNQSRMETAKELALWILSEMPLDSRVGILAGAPVSSLALDPASAETQVKLTETRAAHVDLLSRIRAALDLVLANELERKEIYVITDMMSSSWSSAEPVLKKLLDEYHDEVLLQVIDIGKDDQANWSLGDAEPDFETVADGGDVAIEISITKPDGANNNSATVELFQEDLDPTLPVINSGSLVTPPSKPVDRKVVDFTNASAQKVQLNARNLATGTHHFRIQLDAKDPLSIDNQRFLSILARPTQPTLIVSNDTNAASQLEFVVDLREDRTNTSVRQTRYVQFSEVELNEFAVVCLYNPTPLSVKDGAKLFEFVQRGGGLLIILGSQLGSPQNVNGNPLEDLLPGKVGSVSIRQRQNRNAFMVPVSLGHPVFQVFGETAEEQVWLPYPIFRNWTFASLKPDAQRILDLSEGEQPVVLSQNIGQGQVITFTTPIPEFEGRDLWNELWIADDYWPAFALLLGSFQTLSGADQESMNYSVGVPVSLRNDLRTWPSRYNLFLPDATSKVLSSSEGILNIGSFERAGTYRMRSVRGEPVARGFSINVAANDTVLERLEAESLQDLLGTDNYRLAKDRDELESSVGQARFGRELYPLLMVFVAGLFLAEQAMSNRFYKLKFRRS